MVVPHPSIYNRNITDSSSACPRTNSIYLYNPLNVEVSCTDYFQGTRIILTAKALVSRDIEAL